MKELIQTLKSRFETHKSRHLSVDWSQLEQLFVEHPEYLNVVAEMEATGGEPDLVCFDQDTFAFVDCSKESPKGRRSICYDREAWESRKTFKPVSSAIEQAQKIGIEMLDEDHYRQLQEVGEFDTKTSSWIKTPQEIRALGGAVFMDRRYNQVFLYHNGAESYYTSRAFRGMLRVDL